ncbi:triose-phosphate isomerase [Buchnera aphidicola]|uniref:triose-phosphate isomerase n=1 Tax=Buchnera aphidicola TaxID=9 RepID=UPI00346428D9
MKNFIIAGNWKLHGNQSTTLGFFLKLKDYFLNNRINHKIIIAPPIIYLQSVNQIINNRNFFLGAQNVDLNRQGAFTGEVSAEMLKDIGVKYVIIGHSERRTYHKEDNQIVAKKFQLLKYIGLIPILCIGENLEQKNKNQIQLICKQQIDVILSTSGKYAFKDSIIAYEPIWAIGSGKSADPKYVQSVHQFIKTYISKNSKINYHEIIVQYGGSVNENNIKYFLQESDINGVLLGGSSLTYETFIKIIEIAKNVENIS